MNDTDRKTGFDLRRRQILVLLGTALLTGRAPAQSEFARAPDGNLPVCRVTPAQVEGPYFVDEHLNRSDLRVDPADGSVKNDEDGLFREGGNQLLLALVESGPGYAATFDVGLPMA